MFSVGLGVESADAATIVLRSGGIAVINGDLRLGRRRLALAHELGHFMITDDYSVDWRVADYQAADSRESLFDRFARALLLPEAGLQAEWNAHTRGDYDRMRTAAVRTASSYRVDMATLARRLLELDLINSGDAGKIRSIRATRADIVENGLVIGEELVLPARCRVSTSCPSSAYIEAKRSPRRGRSTCYWTRGTVTCCLACQTAPKTKFGSTSKHDRACECLSRHAIVRAATLVYVLR